MKSELASFKTTDGFSLPWLLYMPARTTKKVALFLHGNGNASVFNNPELQNTIAEALVEKGIAYFPFDNRGAHFIQSLKKKVAGKIKRFTFGSGFELIKECIKDIDGAVAYLKHLGFTEFFLMGSSTGAVKIAVYNFYKPKNLFSGYVFLGASDDTGLYYDTLGRTKFFNALKMAKEKIRKGKGEELAPASVSGAPFMSWKSLFDTIDPEGDYNIFPFNERWNDLKLAKKKKLFREFQSIKTPSLMVYGEHDEFCYGKVPEIVETLGEQASDKSLFDFHILKGSDHGYHGKEKELAELLAGWLASRHS